MSTSSISYKIDLPLMRNIECSVCNETVIEKAAKRALSTTTPLKHELCFYGHMCEGIKTKSIIPHLICEECNPLVRRQSLIKDTFEKCILCNKVPGEDWKEKYTWDKNTHEFRREQESPYIEESEEIAQELARIARNLKEAKIRDHSIVAGGLTAIFIAIIVELYTATTLHCALTLQEKTILAILGGSVGVLQAINAKNRGIEEPKNVIFGAAIGAQLVMVTTGITASFVKLTAEQSINRFTGSPIAALATSIVPFVALKTGLIAARDRATST